MVVRQARHHLRAVQVDELRGRADEARISASLPTNTERSSLTNASAIVKGLTTVMIFPLK